MPSMAHNNPASYLRRSASFLVVSCSIFHRLSAKHLFRPLALLLDSHRTIRAERTGSPFRATRPGGLLRFRRGTEYASEIWNTLRPSTQSTTHFLSTVQCLEAGPGSRHLKHSFFSLNTCALLSTELPRNCLQFLVWYDLSHCAHFFSADAPPGAAFVKTLAVAPSSPFCS